MRKAGELLSNVDGAGGGAGLVVDYGGDRAYGDSFRVSRAGFGCGSGNPRKHQLRPLQGIQKTQAGQRV